MLLKQNWMNQIIHCTSDMILIEYNFILVLLFRILYDYVGLYEMLYLEICYVAYFLKSWGKL